MTAARYETGTDTHKLNLNCCVMFLANFIYIILYLKFYLNLSILKS